MRTFTLPSVLALAIVASAVGCVAQHNYFPPGDTKAGGIRDLMLIYLSKDHWTKDEFRPYVAYLGKDGKPLDWFYDSYLFLQYGGAPSGASYIDGPSIKSDWQAYLDLLFRKDQNLHALEGCVRDVEKALGPCPNKTPIILMIPHPSAKQKDFGDVDGDGKSEDLSIPADRLKAVRWCVDEMLRRWQASTFSAFKLWGFYWMNEGIGPDDEEIVKATSDYIHEVGYGLHWIPYYSAPGVDKLDDLGIDFAILQPNYCFMGSHGQRPDEQRLTDTANRAKRFNLGIEIELPGSGIAGQDQRDNLLDYLSHGRDDLDGYMRSAVHGYYQGTDDIAKLCYSDLPANRALYDALYEFAKDKFKGQAAKLSSGCSYRIKGKVASGYADDGKKLTDGLWANDDTQMERAVGLMGDGAQIEIDLGGVRRIDGVDVRVLAHKDGRSQFPRCINIATSETGNDWHPASRSYRPPASETDEMCRGFMFCDFSPRDARYVRLLVNQEERKRTLLDEIVIRRAESLADGARYTCSPPPNPPDATGCCLTDGIYAMPKPLASCSIGWDAGKEGTVIVELPDPRHIGLVRVSAPALHNDVYEQVKQVRIDVCPDSSGQWTEAGAAKVLPGKSQNHVDVHVEAALAKQVKIVVSPQEGAAVALDEIEVYTADNLARGKPYEFTPAFPAKYGDSAGKELTDGILCEKGFGDGRTVGWGGVEVEVTLDLGDKVKIDGARVHVEGGGYAAVGFPKRMDVLVSDEGRSWSWCGSTEQAPPQLLVDAPMGAHHMQLGWMAARFDPVEARFVMLRVASGGYWTMLSEVEVLSHGRNVAAGKTYHLMPAPASSAKYADTTGKLTDGAYTTGGFGQGRAVGWDKERPCIMLDLGLPTDVAKVSAHVFGGGPGGVWFPRKMSVSTSLDGKTWAPAGDATEHPSEPGKDAMRGYMTVSIEPRKCRYVQLQFDRNGWLMVDETEVYGPTNTGRK